MFDGFGLRMSSWNSRLILYRHEAFFLFSDFKEDMALRQRRWESPELMQKMDQVAQSKAAFAQMESARALDQLMINTSLDVQWGISTKISGHARQKDFEQGVRPDSPSEPAAVERQLVAGDARIDTRLTRLMQQHAQYGACIEEALRLQREQRRNEEETFSMVYVSPRNRHLTPSFHK